MNAATKTPAARITITRVEGPHGMCGNPKTFEGPRCWVAANAWLMGQSETFPAKGGCDKHDFTVEFVDGEKYEGRLDCKASDCDNNDLNVAQHVRGFIEQHAGDRPAAVEYLATYAIP